MKLCRLNKVVAALAIFATVAAGCDSPVDPEDHPQGAVFFSASGAEVARFVYPNSVTGQLQVGVGETVVYDVRILTEDGELADFDGSEYSMQQPRVVIASAATIAIVGNGKLSIVGVNPAATSLRFQLHHGGHEEFEVAGIPLLVQ